MADNKQELDKLQQMMNTMKDQSAPKGEEKTITPGAAGNAEVATDGAEKKKRKPKEVKDQSTLFMEHNIGNGNHLSADSPAGKLMKVNSKLSEIAGFIVPNSPRFDIVVTRNKISKKGETPEVYETRVNVKEKFSQQIKGVIVNFIPELITRINEEKAARGTTPMTGELDFKKPDGTIVKVARKTPEVFEMEAATLDRGTKIYGYPEFIQWMIDYCWFEIQEASAIFWAHKEKRTKTVDGNKTTEIKDIKSPADLRAAQATGYQITSKFEEVKKRYFEKVAKVAGQFKADGKTPKTVKTPTLKDVYPLSSKYRGRKLAIPGNFIAIKKFETITPKASYTPEEQAQMNKMYIREGFSVNKQDSFMRKFNDMSVESKERVNITETGDVNSSQFFAENNSLVANADYLKTVYRWWGKADTTTVLDMRLVKKSEKQVEAKTDKDGNERPAYTKYVLDFVQFGKPGNTLTNAEYQNIVKATDGRLSDGDVTAFISTLNTNSRKDPNTRGGINYDVTTQSAQDIIASLEALASSVNA